MTVIVGDKVVVDNADDEVYFRGYTGVVTLIDGDKCCVAFPELVATSWFYFDELKEKGDE